MQSQIGNAARHRTAALEQWLQNGEMIETTKGLEPCLDTSCPP